MARMRSIKPEFWADRALSTLPRDTRLLYIGLWNLADEHGRLRGDARYVKGQLLPYDDDLTNGDVDKMLDQLADLGKVVRYDSDGETYLYLPNLGRHQRLDAAKVPSRLPSPPGVDDFARDADESGNGADSSVNFPDESGRRANSSALSRLQVAGSREHVAAAARGKFSDTAILAITDLTDATPDEAVAVAELVNSERKPRNLPGFLRSMGPDIQPFVDQVRKASRRDHTAALIEEARRTGTECEHRVPGGAELHPETGKPLCPQCRSAGRAA